VAFDSHTAVLDALPHRPPFLFVDRIIERTQDSIMTEWYVRPDLECFKGHYPGHPVLPGVIACEFAFQSAAIFFKDPRAKQALPGSVPVLARIDNARFKKIVRPGETLRAEIELEESLPKVCYMRARLTSAGQTVMHLKFVVALSEDDTRYGQGEGGATGNLPESFATESGVQES
jgi:3-hydroxyacyl-[acyl-carrier-protein] dehydratase